MEESEENHQQLQLSKQQNNNRNYCRNSQPRTLKFQPAIINYDNQQINYPEISVSSPSLFETSPDQSPHNSFIITTPKY